MSGFPLPAQFRETVFPEEGLDGLDSNQLVADRSQKASWQGWFTARHKGRVQEEAPADTTVVAGRTVGSAGPLPTSSQQAAHGVFLKYIFVHQQKFAFFLHPECREVVVGMFVDSLFVYSQLIETKTQIKTNK